MPVLLGDTSASVHQQPAQADAEILRFYTANWTYIWIKLTDNAPGFKFHGARQETAPRRATLKIPHSWMLHRNKHTNHINYSCPIFCHFWMARTTPPCKTWCQTLCIHNHMDFGKRQMRRDGFSPKLNEFQELLSLWS